MILVYQIGHVLGVMLLVATTFAAFASPDPARRRQSLIASGVLSLIVLTGGMGLLARLGYGWPVWVFGKLACWLVLSALAGIAFRKPDAVGGLRLVAVLAIGIALWLVYAKPFVA